MKKPTQKAITTAAEKNYSFLIQDRKLSEIVVEAPGERTVYSFNPDDDRPKVTDTILTEALEALVRSNPDGFEHVALFLKFPEQYKLAEEVYKTHLNWLYNSTLVDTILGRITSFGDIEKTYDLWSDLKQNSST